MYNRATRDEAYQSELKQFIEKSYGVSIASMQPAKRGFYGETWILSCDDRRIFVKIDYSTPHKDIYKSSLSVAVHLREHGIRHISTVIPTIAGELHSAFHHGVVALFEYVEGENTEDYELSKLFHALAPIYLVPTEGLSIERERFDTECIDIVFRYISKRDQTNQPVFQKLSSYFIPKLPLMHTYANLLILFAKKCKDSCCHFYIMHGDAEGNAIVNSNSFVIVDWDHPKLAPLERDAWFFLGAFISIDMFTSVLREYGKSYEFESYRLAFYCYYSFLYYMQEYFTWLYALSHSGLQDEIAMNLMEYFDGWITRPLKAADKLAFVIK